MNCHKNGQNRSKNTIVGQTWNTDPTFFKFRGRLHPSDSLISVFTSGRNQGSKLKISEIQF